MSHVVCQEECLNHGTWWEELSSRSQDQFQILTGWFVGMLWEHVKTTGIISSALVTAKNKDNEKETECHNGKLNRKKQAFSISNQSREAKSQT